MAILLRQMVEHEPKGGGGGGAARVLEEGRLRPIQQHLSARHCGHVLAAQSTPQQQCLQLSCQISGTLDKVKLLSVKV